MSLKETIHIESIIFREARRLYKRDPDKYGSRVIKWYLDSFVAPTDCELARVARATYYSLRVIDDILDLDREPFDERSPIGFAQDLKEQIMSKHIVGTTEFSELVEYTLRKLELRSRSGDNVRQEFMDAVDEMIFDHNRAKTREALSDEELTAYYNTTFTPLVNITLICLDSKWRAHDIPELSSVQARLYSVRDLEDDWEKGIINVPREILREANLSSSSSINEVKRAESVQHWIQHQLKIGQDEIEHLRRWLNHVRDERIVRFTIKSQLNKVSRIIEEYSYPERGV